MLGADEIGTLAGLDLDAAADLAGRLEVLENRVSLDRRALHDRIDTLQAELVERHKSGAPRSTVSVVKDPVRS